jgi:hypothetical protein
MKSVVYVVALAVAVAFSAPAVAGGATPTNKADCEKAGGHWDDATKKCHKGM